MGSRPRLLLLAAFGLGVCLVGIELMITAIALPRILRDLTDWTQLRQASWIVNGYLVAYIAVMPLAGRAADRFGIPPLFLASLAVFGVGSLASGGAQSLEMLIGARVLQGAGAGAVVPLATAGASHLFTGHDRARALGVIGALTFLGMAVGPFLGAAILDVMDPVSGTLAAQGQAQTAGATLGAPAWRWIFYLGAPLALVAGLYVWAAAPAWAVRRGAASLDIPGALLFTVATASALLSVTWVGAPDKENGGPVVALAIVAFLAATFAVLRFRRAREPFIDLRFFRDRTFSAAVLLSLLTGYTFATAIIGGAVFVDRVRYGGPDEQRVVLGALAGATALGALASGIALRWLGPALLSVAGLGAGVFGLIVLAAAGPGASVAQLALGLALFGLGFGLTVTPRSTAAVEALGRRAFGVASSAVTVARMLGMAVGLAALTVLGSNRIEALSVVLTDAAARDAVLPPALRGRTLQDALVVEALERWAAEQAAEILAALFAIAAVVMAVAVLPALVMRRPPLDSAPNMQTGPKPHGDREGDDDTQPALAL
jgi:MFS transporter, DHA2 family, triacylglyceride efflux pump